MKIEEFRKLKKTKYRSIKEEMDGIIFDSKKEAARYKDLQFLLKVGKIKNLTIKPVYPIEFGGIKICKVIPDFQYFDTETKEKIVEDVKSKPTMTRVYRLKKKLLKACYGIEIREVLG